MVKWFYVLDTKDISDQLDSETINLQEYAKELVKRLEEFKQKAVRHPYIQKDEWKGLLSWLQDIIDAWELHVDEDEPDKEEMQYVRDQLDDWGNTPIHHHITEQMMGRLCWINHVFEPNLDQIAARNGYTPAHLTKAQGKP